ncbi:MAG: Asp-tRNA(Asn)/Glu-tRNA(Gln) amidotransferase subunit GatB [Deltaproteobacteria bacterium]|jgi:aspartyl-tRNA(Asn)/glutamyl-tRNA(Gln) amidotransferase subunit B|nr:Asp-tRNA(Asn)/Glu-tRNA(Gln) amidotransferase subunit GatB [Deltaproteobacteria bacterium]
MVDLEAVIGLEIHAQLKTKTKLFCACPLDSGAEPNTNICEVCAGQPGALPRLNAKAVELAAKAGLALGCQVNASSLFARKNYTYPDLPNGFQTSQVDPPICLGGVLEIAAPDGPKTVRLNRIHLEDDAGKCVHDEKRGKTLVDLNRAGTPLIEIVTEPDLSSSAEAVTFLKKLHELLVDLEVTEGRLEEGEFRCDVNVSLRPKGASRLGVRSEVKNLNSFRFVGQAIDSEIRRQTGLYRDGEPVLQETLHFDSASCATRTLRSKEEAHDYRYFPQPDLPPVQVDEALLAALKASLPAGRELTRERLAGLGLGEEQIRLLLDRRGAVEHFDQTVAAGGEPKRVAGLMAELFLPACAKAELSPASAVFGPAGLAALATLLDEDQLGRRAAFVIFDELFSTGDDPRDLARRRGLLQISDAGALADLAAEVLADHPAEVEKYRLGQEKILGFLIGQLMRRSGGAADPKGAGRILSDLIKAGQ